jgi:hypothetical protein
MAISRPKQSRMPERQLRSIETLALLGCDWYDQILGAPNSLLVRAVHIYGEEGVSCCSVRWRAESSSTAPAASFLSSTFLDGFFSRIFVTSSLTHTFLSPQGRCLGKGIQSSD